jgi:uncharacterized protein (DUF1810 family)
VTSTFGADAYDLQRFVSAQSGVYPQVLEELSAGRKRSHWMWFVFPQIAGLGFSAMAQRFAIGSEAEAEGYLAHEILGPRLIECTRLVMAAGEKPINAILGSPDDIKFRSSMTLFDAVSKRSDRYVLSGRQGFSDTQDPPEYQRLATALLLR